MCAVIDQAQIRHLLTLIAGMEPGEPIKGVHSAAATALGWTEGAVWNLWYGRGSVPKFIALLRTKNNELLAAQRAKAQREAAELTAILARLENVGREKQEECQDGGQR